MSSVAQTLPLVSNIIQTEGPPSDTECLDLLNEATDSSFHSIQDVAKTSQHALSLLVDLRCRKELVASVTDTRTQALLNSVSLPHSGDWLNVLPSSSTSRSILRISGWWPSTAWGCPSTPPTASAPPARPPMMSLAITPFSARPTARGPLVITGFGTHYTSQLTQLLLRLSGNDKTSSPHCSNL